MTSLLKFAKETTNPHLAAVLIKKAADLKSQVDESSATPDPTAQAPGCRSRNQSPRYWLSVSRVPEGLSP